MSNKTKSDLNKRGSRQDPELPRIQRILVPVDFSDSSVNALRYAMGLAIKFHASLTVVHVVAADYGWLGIGQDASPEYDETLQSQAGDQLRALAKTYIPENASANLEVRLGRPAEEIVAAAVESKADLIILSTQGHAGLDRLLIGSVADRVARLAPCPVFLMRPGKPSPEQKKVSPAVLRFKHTAKPAL